MGPLRTRFFFAFVSDAVFLTAVAMSLVGCLRPHVETDVRVPIDLGAEETWIYATHPLLPLDARQVRSAAVSALDATDLLVAAASSPPPAASASVGRLVVRVDDVQAGPELGVAARIELTLPSGQTLQASGRGRGEAADALTAAVLGALEEALWESHADRLSDDELIEALSAASSSRRQIAATRLAARRHPAVLKALSEMLGEPCTSEQASVALGGLAALGDVRGVRSIVDALERCDDPSFSLQAVYVLGGLGGVEAEAYLFTLIAGHADPRLRAAASEAHATLLRNVTVRAESGD